VNIINSLFKFDCLPAFADHITFQLCKSFVGVFLKPTHKGFGNEFIWCVFMDELIRNVKNCKRTGQNLNAKEVSDLFGIGQHRLREIVREDYGNKYHLMSGRTIKIKRKQFGEFIDNVEQI